MRFSLSTTGITLQGDGGDVTLTTDGPVTLNRNALAELLAAVEVAAKLCGATAGEAQAAPSVGSTPAGPAPAPEALQSPYPGPVKRGPRRTADRAGPGRGARPAAEPGKPHRAPMQTVGGDRRQRGPLVKYMIEWLAANPGEHTVDAIVAAAEDGSWSEAKALRAAIIAALRRARHKIQRHSNGKFSLVDKTKPPPGKIVRRPARRGPGPVAKAGNR